MGLLDDVVDEARLMDRATEVALREAPKCAPGSWGFIKVSLLSAWLMSGAILPPIH